MFFTLLNSAMCLNSWCTLEAMFRFLTFPPFCYVKFELEDLKVLRRSPDLLNNVTIGQGQLQLILEQILFYHIWGLQTFLSSDLNNLMNNPSNSPVISEKQMFR